MIRYTAAKRKAFCFIGVLVLALVVAPVSFFAAMCLHPVWRWVENEFGVEAIGHSGPSEWVFALCYGLILAVTLLAYRRISRNR